MGVKIDRKVVAFDTWQGKTIIPPGYSAFIHYKDGTWNINPGKHGTKQYGPEGSAVSANENYPLPGEKEGCLIGRLLYSPATKSNNGLVLSYPELEKEGNNNESVLFTIKREGLLIPKSDYPKVLHMRCNDIDTGVFDNEGELHLVVEIW